MHFSEDDLKQALRREDPGPGFTQRVMAQIRLREEALANAQKQDRPVRRWIWSWRPALVSGLAAVLLIGGGLGYRQYERIQAKKRVEEQNAALAKQQMMLALKITNAKLSHVFQRVSGASGDAGKIRRQSL